MSHTNTNTLAPSKSTVYISNLPFSLTNNDLHKLFCHHGKIARVTIQKDKESRQSKGVAFVLYSEPTSALACVQEHNDTQIGGRTIKCSIAKNNGRTTEFMKKREYGDKSRCFECGEAGHLSYSCSKNLLGSREPPVKKKKKKKKKKMDNDSSRNDEEDEEYDDDNDDETLGVAIAFQRMKDEQETRAGGSKGESVCSSEVKKSKKLYVRDGYFSDEEHLHD